MKEDPKSFTHLELSISGVENFDTMMNYWKHISNVRAIEAGANRDDVDDLWTEATLGFYLFLLESYVVMMLKSIEWCKNNNYNDYPHFLKSLKGNEEIFRFADFNKGEHCDKNKACLYNTFLKTGNIYGILNIIALDHPILIAYIIEHLLPDSFNKLIKAGYNPSDDTPIENKDHINYILQ